MSLGDAVVRAARKQQALPTAMVGEIRTLSFTAAPLSGEVGLLVGVSPDLIPVPLSGWASTFIDRVRASGRALIGTQVIVWMVSGQPMIMDTKGV